MDCVASAWRQEEAAALAGTDSCSTWSVSQKSMSRRSSSLNFDFGKSVNIYENHCGYHVLTSKLPPACEHLMPRKELTKQQASQLTSEEYNQLNLSYSSLFKSALLTDSNSIELSTLEGVSYTLEVTADGWKVIAGGKPSERERTWEMVEDLLR